MPGGYILIDGVDWRETSSKVFERMRSDADQQAGLPM
jgi:hypothetical protein